MAWRLALLVLGAWCVGAILFGGGSGEISLFRWSLAACYALFVFSAVGRATRTDLVFAGLGAVAVIGWFLTITPSNDRAWSEDQSRLSWAEIDGPLLHVKDVRDFRYRSTDDWDARWYDRTYDTRRLEKVWFVVEPFAEFEGAAHTMVTFGFSDGRYLAVSVELRKEPGEQFGVLAGLYKQFELMYVFADERDVIQLRTNHRKDRVYLHPIATSQEGMTAFLLDMVKRANALRERPEFYNTLTSSCTTNLVDHLEAVSDVDVPVDYRVMLPGWSGELAYELGLIDTDLSFEATRERDLVTPRGQAADGRDDYSARIRAPVKASE